ncbi:hypothetical protein C8R44DRAFT_321816 [Mycena epipterygia]|nr:hypothetical protein C8R44DRAFT_321816 [Mycena epipterygia]
MTRARPATIFELETFAQADPDVVAPSVMDIMYYLGRTEAHRRAGWELASGAGSGPTKRNPRGRFDAGADMEEAFVEYTRAATLIRETIPGHPDYATLLNAEQRAILAEDGADSLYRLDQFKPMLIERYQRYACSPAASASDVPIFMLSRFVSRSRSKYSRTSQF